MSSTRVVAIGGGHGLAASLAALRRNSDRLTAVVSVADDGGSSGRLRETFGIHPPGDLRKCLVAMGDPDSIWTSAFEYRFQGGELEGHALGNLVIAGLTEATGDFTVALEEAGRLVGAAGQVLPATTVPVVLKAESADGEVEGQVAVASAGRIARVSIVPPDARAPAAAIEAVERADQIVIGPGSLYTSVLAVVAVRDLRDALARTRARKVYVCNLAPQVPETSGYDVAAHVDALGAHGLEVDVVLCDTSSMPLGKLDRPHLDRPLGGRSPRAHDAERLAAALAELS